MAKRLVNGDRYLRKWELAIKVSKIDREEKNGKNLWKNMFLSEAV